VTVYGQNSWSSFPGKSPFIFTPVSNNGIQDNTGTVYFVVLALFHLRQEKLLYSTLTITKQMRNTVLLTSGVCLETFSCEKLQKNILQNRKFRKAY